MKIQKQTPELIDLLTAFKTQIFATMNCINIGIVQSFDTKTQTASIKLSIKRIKEIKQDGTKVTEDRPLLAEVPCIVIGGSHNVRVPVVAGDIAIVLFNDRDIDNWFVNNSSNTVEPNTLRLHDVSDGIAIIGLHNASNLISDFLNDRISLYWDASNKLEVLSGAINALTALMTITGALKVTGQIEGGTIKADNGASGTSITVSGSITAVNGIVTAIS